MLNTSNEKCTWSVLSKGLTDYETCKLAIDNCGSVHESINLFSIRYCILKNSIFHVILVIFFALVSFYWLARVSDKRLSPALSKISNAMRLSQTIAGVTLLALANGAPDVIAGIAAADLDTPQDADGVFVAAGALFGSCTFGCTVVLGYCIIASKGGVEVSLSV